MCRAMALAVVLVSVAKGRAFQAHGLPGRTRLLSSRPAALSAERVIRPQQDAADAAPVGARPDAEGRAADSLSFFERIGSPRYIAAPMVEQSEAGAREGALLVVHTDAFG